MPRAHPPRFFPRIASTFRALAHSYFAPMDQPALDRFGMPFKGDPNAPRFAGDKTTLVDFLESVERFALPGSLSDKEIIKYALRYTVGDDRELFSFYEGNSYEEFANAALDFYPECGTAHYMRPKCANSTPISAPIDAPPSHTPPHLECAQAQPSAPAIAPIREIREANLAPASPEPSISEITPAPAYIKSPIARAPAQPTFTPQHPLAEAILPQPEIREPSITANAPEAPLEQIASPMVSNDLKHSSHFSAPYQEPSAVSVVYYAKHFAQSLSLTTSLVTDDFAHIAFFAYSDYRLPVKHPCLILPISQVEHVSGDPDANHVPHIASDFAQGARLEALYIHPHPNSHFSRISRLELSRSYSTVSNMFLLPSHHLSSSGLLTRKVRAPRAFIPTHHAPIITEEFSHYRIFIISSCLNHISFIQLVPYFLQPSRRDSGARLTHAHSHIALDITLNFALFAFSPFMVILSSHALTTPRLCLGAYCTLIQCPYSSSAPPSRPISPCIHPSLLHLQKNNLSSRPQRI
ncbi:hypothetical protein CY34DRAFT_19275 [Suillus luteus UH-Slu-Lm8-n1]|uniref:Uncharacterized protein n=1 Tax=Suillus luteus UH-Slu-Lm8-n1 TaxID=930992 RepID=A0A0C9Z406_9AGAM|nr:hypothetical protein CY34DRAFT_19275 [Suillus luteus UH-Slu-Lm8-n1]